MSEAGNGKEEEVAKGKSRGVGPRLLSGGGFGPPPGKGGDDEAVLEAYLDEVSRYPVLHHEEQTKLAVLAQQGRRSAEHRLVRSNLRLVLAMSVRYRGRGMSLADLVQEGNHGLMQAVSRFDVEKQVRFSTYALWWIRQSLERAVANQSRTIRLPIHFRERINRIRKARDELQRHLVREPTLEEIADQIQLDLKKVKDAIKNQNDALSLDVTVGDEDGGSPLSERVSDDKDWDPGRFVHARQKSDDVRWMLNRLDPKERTVLERRYGLSDGQTRTLEQVGRTMNITRERVRQIEAKALNKLREAEIQDRVEAYVRG